MTKKLQLFHKSARGALAIRPSALSYYWAWGEGEPNEVVGPATVVHIQGPLEQRSQWWDGYDLIVERFRIALNEDTEVVILRIDSPGGECAGCFDAVTKMRAMAAASGKRIIAFADESAYSAAYAMACVANEIYLPRAGGVGSVGVIAVVADCVGLNERIGINVAVVFSGEHKADCHPDIPLSDDALAGVQKDVDTLADMFRELVSGARGISDESVASLEAATLMGEEGITAGLADGVMTFDELIAMLESDIAADAKTPREANAMTIKKKSSKTKTKASASTLVTTDLMTKPQVAGVDPVAMAAVAAMMTDNTKPLAAKDDSTTTSTTTTTEEVEADGTTTTTTESEETVIEPGADDEEEDDDDEEEDDDDAPPSSKSAAAVRPAPVAAQPTTGKRTSADVLALVKEMTGATSPGEQLAALRELAATAATVEASRKEARKAARVAAKRELRTTVDAAIRSGKLAPAQREWAMSAGLATVNGFLGTAKPLIRTAPTTPGKAASAATTNTGLPSTGNATLDASVANVASLMMIEPADLQAHAVALKNAGIIH